MYQLSACPLYLKPQHWIWPLREKVQITGSLTEGWVPMWTGLKVKKEHAKDRESMQEVRRNNQGTVHSLIRTSAIIYISFHLLFA